MENIPQKVFEPEKRNKRKVAITIRPELDKMIKDIQDDHLEKKKKKISYSTTINEILDYFREEYWDKGEEDKDE